MIVLRVLAIWTFVIGAGYILYTDHQKREADLRDFCQDRPERYQIVCAKFLKGNGE